MRGGLRASLVFIIPQAAGGHPQVVLLDRTDIIVVHYDRSPPSQ